MIYQQEWASVKIRKARQIPVNIRKVSSVVQPYTYRILGDSAVYENPGGPVANLVLTRSSGSNVVVHYDTTFNDRTWSKKFSQFVLCATEM